MTDSRRTETASSWSDGGERAPIGLLAPGTALGERYEIREVLGHGGFAVVYLAHDRKLDRDVALKILREDRLTPGSLSRLKREVRVARDLAHPNLLRVFDIESSGPAVFLTMEAIHGGSLRQQLRGGPLPIEIAVALAEQLFRALDALHGVGIVHRDLKPGNVLLTEEGQVKIADFGLALHLEGGDTRVTATETAVGTLEYLSPEQALGEPLDARSDLYSAGVLLFEMLTGRLPHAGRSSLGNLIARFRERPPDLAELRPETPAWLARLVARLLARDREERYASAAAVLRDIERRRAATGPSRRRRLAIVGSLLAVVVATLGVIAMVETRGHRFAQIVHVGDSNVLALDQRDRILWRRDRLWRLGNFVPFRPHPGAAPAIAAIQVDADSLDLDAALRLDLLDAQTGEKLETIELADGSDSFPSFARTYSFSISVVDLDGDGADELLVDFSHQPWWPFFSVLVEPKLHRSRVVYVAGGHQIFRTAADLNGDGRKEILFAGINNPMGWRLGVAAVQLSPGVGESVPGRVAPACAAAANLAIATFGKEALLWYALGPRRFLADSGPTVAVDARSRTIDLHFQDGSTEQLGFDGLPVEPDAPPFDTRRMAAHRDAWLAARETLRLFDTGATPEAGAWIARGLAEATAAGTPHLAVWFRHARLLAAAAAGDDATVDQDLETTLAGEPETASELAYRLGRIWHGRGELDRAVAAYRRGRASPGYAAGRGPFEYLEGIVLALIEAGRPEEALAEARAAEGPLSDSPIHAALYVEFARWRLGERPDASRVQGGLNAPDLHRYWKLEFELADDGARASELLSRLDEEG
ncbi:MAG: serine/threonine protein kinase, partial [Acidobacteria bacterium]|nr:serine/threonine protein kinase [Acidobacteriota bacterium]